MLLHYSHKPDVSPAENRHFRDFPARSSVYFFPTRIKNKSVKKRRIKININRARGIRIAVRNSQLSFLIFATDSNGYFFATLIMRHD